jgi:membrane-bound lytic murein transglycosylase A
MRAVFRVGLAVLAMAGPKLWEWQHPDAVAGERLPVDKTKLEFTAIAGWDKDDHRGAFATFRKSCAKILSPSADADPGATSRLADICKIAVMLPAKLTETDAKAFFEQNFDPWLVKRPDKGAMLTGYFEPEIKGSLKPTKTFTTPIYNKPDDLVLMTRVANRASLPADLTAGRTAPEGLVPYYTRQEIEQGALNGRGLEIAYLSDPFEAFIMQIQGSGLIRLPDGRGLRIGFVAKNGHPYTSVGKLLVERGELAPEGASMDSILAWMRANKQRGRELMWENKSYAFFRPLSTSEAEEGPQGAMQLPLIAGRSLAVDPRYHELGSPIWVSAPTLKDLHGKPVERLLIAQDTGSAIRGPVRGDIFWGSGEAAGKIAGQTNHICDFYTLLPK